LAQAKRAAEMRFLAARVTISGRTRLHETLAQDPESCREQTRAIGIEVGDVWIEKVLLATTSVRTSDAARPVEDAIGELLRVAAEVLSDEAKLAELSDSLAPLFDRLPSELREGEGGLGWRDAERMRALVTRAQAMLLGRLVPAEPDP